MALQKVDLTTPQPGGKVGEPTKEAWRKFNENVDETAALVEAAGAGADAAAEQVAALEEALGDAAYAPASSFATASQGAKAESAVQPDQLAATAGTLQSQLDTIVSAQQAGAIAESTWSRLISVEPGLSVAIGGAADIPPETDGGSHVDPIKPGGQVVPNAGRFVRRTAAADGWEWLAANVLSGKADKSELAEVAGVASASIPNYLDADLDGLNQVARGLREDGTSTMLAAEVGGLRIARLSDTQASIEGSMLWHGIAEEFALELSGQFEGAFYVEMDEIGVVRFAILADGSQYPPVDVPAQRSFVLAEQIILPDGAQGQNPNGGWTSTGLDIPSTGKWRGCAIIGNDGRVYEGTQGGITAPFQCSLVCTSPDFRRILWEIPCNTAAFPGIESIQGVAWDTSDNTIWFADKTNKTIRHVTVGGTKLLDEIVVTHALNGIAYRSDLDAIYTADEGTNTLRLVSCADGAVLRTQVGIHPQADQLHYEMGRNRLWITVGSNGEDGRALVYDADTLQLLETHILAGSQAIEGLHYNPASRVLITVNDGAFHLAANPALAVACKYTYQ